LQELVKHLRNEYSSDAVSESQEETFNAEKKQSYDLETIKEIEHELHEAAELQAMFQYSLEQLTEAFQAIAGSPKLGIVYNYIASLEGPVSRFFIAEQNGIKLIETLSKDLAPVISPSEALSANPRQAILDLQAKMARSTNFFRP
jgi:hypothetical protein